MLRGKVTIPTDVDIIDDTLRLIDLWGADAIRDSDRTKMPGAWDYLSIKKYATYHTTRDDNEWARNNPDEMQQIYLMTDFITAKSNELRIDIMKHFSKKQLKPNTRDDITKWWEVMDRTTGNVVETKSWYYNAITEEIIITEAKMFHSYTVSFLAYILWDSIHMRDTLVNELSDEPQMTYDIRQPKTQKYAFCKLEKWLSENPNVDIVRFATFFHQFPLIYDEMEQEKYIDYFGYSASVSPCVLQKFERRVGYKFRPEYIVDMGYQNTTFRIPSKEYKDFMDFQQKEVAELIKIFSKVTHYFQKEVMMFLGAQWIGAEPYGKYFKNLNLDAVVGPIKDGTSLRYLSDISGVKYKEGRFIPYFSLKYFGNGTDPVKKAKENWSLIRRAIMRSPIQRIGYGGDLKLIYDFPDFVLYIKKVCDEFREISHNMGNCKPYSAPFKVYILNCWGKLRSWTSHMVDSSVYPKETHSYNGVLEALSGMPFEVQFISFEDIKYKKDILKGTGVIINIGDAYTAFSGGEYWDDPNIVAKIRKFVYEGGGFIGIGEPSAYEKQGHFFQLYDVLGVDKELSFSLCTKRYNIEEKKHFITEDCNNEINFGDRLRSIYALPDTTVIKQENTNILLTANDYGKGRGVYLAGLPFDPQNIRLLTRAIYYAAKKERDMKKWYSDNYNVEINAYLEENRFCIVNNTHKPQDTAVYKGDGTSLPVHIGESEVKWYPI